MWIPWTCHRLTGVERDCKSCRLCRKDEKGCWIKAVGKPIQDSCHGFKTRHLPWTFKFQSISVNVCSAEVEATRPPTPTTSLPAKVPVAPRVKPPVDAAGLQGFRRLMAAYGYNMLPVQWFEWDLLLVTWSGKFETEMIWNNIKWFCMAVGKKDMTKQERMKMIHTDVS